MTQTKIPAELIAAVNDKRRAALDADYAALIPFQCNFRRHQTEKWRRSC